MISNSTLKVPTTALMPYNAFSKTTSWIWGCMLLTVLLFSGVSFGQTDGCGNGAAGQLTVGTSCNATTFNSNNDTRYWTNATGCGAASNRDDAWGWFDATSTSTTIIYQPAANRDAILHLFSAACNQNMTSVACSDEIGFGAAETIVYATTIGTRYRVRIQNYYGNQTMNGTICVYNTPPPPPNEECTGAIELFSDTTCNTVTATTESATGTLAGCTGNADDDVWFNFTAVSDTHTIAVTEGTLDDAVFEIFTGSCGTLTSVLCIDDYFNDESAEISGFTPGDTYYIRVYSFANISGTFDICITNTPVNDECSGAIELFTDTTCNNVLGSTVGATESLPGCDGNADDDVWYQFTATQTNATVSVTLLTGNMVFEVFSGSCGALTSLECVNNNVGTIETVDLNGLTVGGTYYIRTYSQGGADGTFNICVTTQCKTWNGSDDANWNNADNWTPDGIPDEYDCVIIPDVGANPDPLVLGPPVPPTPSYARNITIENNGILELQSGSNLTVTDWINVAPNGTFEIRNNASLVQVTDVAVNQNTGNSNMYRTVSSVNSQDYVYWSTPTEGAEVGDLSPGTNPGLIWQWNSTVGANTNGYGEWTNASGVMAIGQGYIVRGLSGTATANTALFTGRINNGIINVPISKGTYVGAPYAAAGATATELDDNWNLIGNPYPSAILADDFIAFNATLISDEVNPSITGTIYLWTHQSAPSTAEDDPFYENYVYNYNADDYISYNLTGPNPSPAQFSGYIGAGQSFFVLMDNDASVPVNANVQFNNTMRDGSYRNDQFLRASEETNSVERHRIWLDLINSNNNAASTLVGYIEGATNGIDRLFDGDDLSATNLKLYSIVEDKSMAIQGRSLPFNVEDVIPLGYNVGSNGTFTIAVNNLDGLFETTNQAIYLEDMLTNTIHDLKANPYVFTTVSGTYNDRFLLRFTNETLGIDDPALNSGLNIISYNNEIKVTSTNNPINTIEVYDILGRTIATHKDVNVTEFKFNLSSMSNGTFIVKATLYNGQQKVKKIVN